MDKKPISILFGPLLCAAMIAALPAAAHAGEASKEEEAEAPYVTSPDYVVDKMLDLGQVEAGDYVIDLGSGDGRIVIGAARRGAFGLGVDIDPELVRESRRNAADAGVEDRVMFLQQDLFETEIREASVVTLYLLQSLNLKLRPRLLEELRPGTRVVSHNYHMGDWEPDAEATFGQSGTLPWSVVYAWIVPADVAGTWRWQIDGHRFRWRVEQQYQKLFTRIAREETPLTPENVELNGRRIGFTTEHDGTRYIFSGRAEGDRIDGIVKVHSDGRRRIHEWLAERR